MQGIQEMFQIKPMVQNMRNYKNDTYHQNKENKLLMNLGYCQ